MTEQERVLAAANVLSAHKWVVSSDSRRQRWQKKGVLVTSGEVADLTGLPIDVVEAAIKNIGEAVEA